MDRSEIRAFVDRWVEDWNAHNLDAVLEHFADHVVFTSPNAAEWIPTTGGVIRGKAALREYWSVGLRAQPDLHFEVIASYAGVNTLVINFRNQHGRVANEVLTFDGPLVVEGHATHLDG
ncbi:nuclear transport factor 2 family protein [Actinopolymorpha sp. B11F2]|uniref:YybH family protein n=1 Tax=Actinopolymorpha sp. B11F2 TaxID=3160862 RepID=UPI0032E4C924